MRMLLSPLSLLCILTSALACQCEPSTPAKPEVYTTRVEVVAVEGTGDALRAQLKHEPIPAFKDRDGKAAAMPSMTMAFGLDEKIDPSTLAPGTKHAITFDVVYGREPTLRVTQATRLPDDTALTLPAGH